MEGLVGTSWTLLAFGDGDAPAVTDDARPTLTFDAERVSGFAGCNRFNGGFRTQAMELMLGPLMTTLMACPDPAASIEREFLSALAATRTFSLNADALTLADDDGLPLLRLDRVSAFSLSGTAWTVVGVNNGRGGVQSVHDATMLTLSFADDGSISGSTGCNLFRGAFTHDAPSGALTLEGVASTRKACPNPEAATQEQAFLEALRSATSVRLDRDRLELRSDDGALQVSLRTATA